MSAAYPLVRNLQRLLDALRACRRSPSRSGSSPSSASSCLIEFLHRPIVSLVSVPSAWRTAARRTVRRRALRQTATTPRQRAAGRRRLGRAARRRAGATSRPRGSSRARDYWLGSARAGARAPRAVSSTASPRRSTADRAAAEPARRAFLDRGEHGRACRVVRRCGRGSNTAGRIKDRARRRCCGSTRRFSMARPTARWDAGISRCRVCSAAVNKQSEAAPAQVADLQPAQHRLALTSSPRRCSTTAGRREARAELQTGARRAARSGLGARRSGVQAKAATLLQRR